MQFVYFLTLLIIPLHTLSRRSSSSFADCVLWALAVGHRVLQRASGSALIDMYPNSSPNPGLLLVVPPQLSVLLGVATCDDSNRFPQIPRFWHLGPIWRHPAILATMASFDPSQPPLVSETLLKKRRSLEELALRRSEQLSKEVKRRRVIRGENVKILRPEQIVIRQRVQEGSKKKFDRKSQQAAAKLSARGTVLPANRVKATVGFAVRVQAAKNASTVIKSQLKALGLDKKYQGVFVRLDQEMLGNTLPPSSAPLVH